MRCLPGILLLALCVLGCEPDVKSAWFQCTDGVCPRGWRCVDAICYRPGEAPPADGGADSGSPDTGVDAGPSCRVVDGTGCAVGQTCELLDAVTPATASVQCVAAASRGGSGHLDPCTSDAQCRSGFACLGADDGCLAVCVDAGDCAVTERCETFTPRIVVGDVEYGLCRF